MTDRYKLNQLPKPVLYMKIPGAKPFPYWEIQPGSPVYMFSSNGSRAERTFIVEWNKRNAFVKGILGFCYIRNYPNKTTVAERTAISRVIPDYMPDITNSRFVRRFFPLMQEDFYIDELVDAHVPEAVSSRWLYATQITRMEGLEPLNHALPIGGVAEYNYALVTVMYEPLTFKILSDAELLASSPFIGKKNWFPKHSNNWGSPINPAAGVPETTGTWEWHLERYVTRTVKPIVEYLSVGKGSYYYVLPNGKKVPFPHPRALLQPSVEVIYVWHQVPFIPQGARELIGHVNSHYFDPMREVIFQHGQEERGFRPGTLLYTSCEVKPYRHANGDLLHDITYRMKYMERVDFDEKDNRLYGRGHNYFLRWFTTQKQMYYKITHNGNEDELGDPFSFPPREPPALKDQGLPPYPYADFRKLFCFRF